MSNTATTPLYSFIIPVYNTGNFIYETLDSVAAQTFDLNLFQVIVIDDCSTDSHTQGIINQLMQEPVYKGLQVEVIRNSKNSWLAETRNIGVRIAKGKYLVCLDSDDTIEPDFIKHTTLAFAAYPDASWVYPSVRKFGYRNQIDIAPDFSAKKLFLENYVVAVSPVRRDLWEKLGGQRTFKISEKVKLFEDWDFWQRALALGKFGVPIRKVIFNYRQNVTSLISRSEEEGSLSSLMSYRKNWTALLSLRSSYKNFEKNNFKNLNNYGLLTKIFRKMIQLIFKRKPYNFSLGDIMSYVFVPSGFAQKRLNTGKSLTKAHKFAGFKQGFELKVGNGEPVKHITKNTLLCTHFTWAVGGAENVLFDYLKVVGQQGIKIVDVVTLSDGGNSALRAKFKNIATEQFSLDEIADGPYPRLLALWELIKMERPKYILNMSNPFLYLLTPLLKEKFPNTVVCDLLHCEEYNENGWFEAAFPFQSFIDKRIVISEFWKKVLIDKYKEQADKINVVYNMVDTERLLKNNYSRNELLTLSKINPSKKVIGFLGRFHEQKRPDIFIALAEKMQFNSDYHFVMAGSGGLLNGLKDRMSQLSNLTYLGPTQSPEKIFPMFDVAVFPSRFEGYALVSMECACLSIPVIVPDIHGFNEQINNGNFGLMYPIVNDEKDVESISNILINRYDELQGLKVNGPTFIKQYHNKTEIEQSIKALF
ncbi:MAG: glycosyltransferase [Bacteroidota bacterium]